MQGWSAYEIEVLRSCHVRFSNNSKYPVPPNGIFCLITFYLPSVVAEWIVNAPYTSLVASIDSVSQAFLPHLQTYSTNPGQRPLIMARTDRRQLSCYIHPTDTSLFAFAGIWTIWRHQDHTWRTYSLDACLSAFRGLSARTITHGRFSTASKLTFITNVYAISL